MAESLERHDLRTHAIECACLGARIARPYLGRVSVSRKPDRSPVTEADHAAQAGILDCVAKRFPDHAVIVEEVLAEASRHAPVDDAEYCWVVDPIDGTRNFAAGLPIFAVSVAVMHAGTPVAGAIWDATSDAVFSAQLGGGAFRHETRLTPCDRPIGPDSNVAISSIHHRPAPAPVHQWIDRFVHRSVGSVCLHLAWVAAGIVDAAFAIECKLWDVAAGALLISEVDGVVTDPAGRSLWPMDLARYDRGDLPVLAGTPTMHAELLSTLTGESEQDIAR